ncbi:hypothetical protein [Aeromicrobium stalagmiti]|uniref:hypothetical protein n=1 Tax=Aeromicrobium stalagmiti TaxID=2738988 RepID=UPI0015699043|nr:hypothetical protein [Aeromicrobium stalagmiti]NRQ49897.1 hypothetical protein [Aeromicrobium stalagmiti]
MTSSFAGHIAGLGTASGTRIVVGMWDASPYGTFADVMLEQPSGHRILIAPRQEIADFVASTYAFDEIRIEPVSVTHGAEWSVHTRSLQVRFTPGKRLWVSPLLALVPAVLRRTASWARVCNPIASRLMPGVQTYGSAGGGRTEWYAATGVRRLSCARATWEGDELGDLAQVTPPVRFGFASSPAQPTLTALTSYVREAVA